MISQRSTPHLAKTFLVPLVAVVTTGLGLAACGDTSSKAIAASFREQANAICARAVADHAQHPFPLESFDPLHPDPSQLPALADYFSRYGDSNQTEDELIALGEPAKGRFQWDHLVTLVKKATANGAEQIAAARSQDVPRFVALVRSAQRIHDEIAKTGSQGGFAPSSPCGRVF